MSALGTVSTMSLAAISDTAIFAPIHRSPPTSTLCCEQGFNRVLQLILGIGFAKAFHAVDEHGFHLVGNKVSGGVEHAQLRPKLDGLASELASAEDGILQIYVGKEAVDLS